MAPRKHALHHRLPAHPAHPMPPQHIKPPPEPVKQHEDVQSYLISLTMAIDQCKTDWEHYGHAVSHAYAWAWNTQSGVLREVKESIEKRKKQEEADALFALNLLTCGLGGGLAAACARKVLSTAGDELKEEFVKTMVDKAKDKGKELGKKASEFLYKHLGPPEVTDAFKPVGTEPVQFGEEIMEGIEDRVGTLWDLAVSLRQQAMNGLTLEGVRAVYESIVTRPFVTDRPSRQLTGAALRPRALMALWLSWGWCRDVPYWRTHSHAFTNTEENMDFEPVRASLLSIGVPEARISQPLLWGDFGAMKRLDGFRKMQPEAKFEELKLIDMTGFINWCNSNDAIELLFRGLPKKLEWFNQIPVQMTLRRALGPYARYVPPPSP